MDDNSRYPEIRRLKLPQGVWRERVSRWRFSVMRALVTIGSLTAAVLLTSCGTSGPDSSSFDIGSVQDSVARITTIGTFATADGTREQKYTGSGFVVDPSGYIVTNNHVVTGGAYWKVTIGKSPTVLDAHIIAVSECDDLALLKVSGTFPALELSSQAPAIGTQISVAGHPNGDPYTLTNGTVAKDPYVSESSWASVTQEIQVTAQTYPGNSGGPVVDNRGQVVGIEYAAGTPGSSIANESFAIAASEAGPVIERLKAGKDTGEFYLGLNSRASADKSGINVISVAPGSPADKAGIEAGDKLRNLNGTAVGATGTKESYCSVLRSNPNSDAVLTVTVNRNDAVGNDTVFNGQINGRPLLALLATGGVASPPGGDNTGGVPPGSSSSNTGGEPPAPGGGGEKTASGSSSGGLSALKGRVPDAILSTCTDVTGTEPSANLAAAGSIASAMCQLPGVDGVYYDLFATTQGLAAYYKKRVTAAGATTSESGLCNSGAKDTPFSIPFADGSKLEGPGYRVICSKTSSAAWLEESFPADTMLVTIRLLSGDQLALYNWWSNSRLTVNPHP